MSSVKDDLAKKKERLAQLKAQREARQAASKAGGGDSSARTTRAQARAAASAQAETKPAPSVDDLVKSVDNLIGSQPREDPASTSSATARGDGVTGASGGTENTTTAAPRPQRPLSSTTQINVVDIPPKIVEVYSKETQTLDADGVDVEEGGEPGDIVAPSPAKYATPVAELTPAQKEEVLSSASFQSFFSQVSPSVCEALGIETNERALMDPKERDEVETSEDFNTFFSSASKVMERTLGQAELYDPLVDYAADEDGPSTRDIADQIRLQETYSDERWTRHRVVTDIAWSPHHPELFAVSFTAKQETVSQDPDGLVMIWSILLPSRPEYIFTCQSAVMTIKFSEYNPTFLLGGTYSGQIVLWDTRAKVTTPIQRTPLSSEGHTHPVYAMQIVGTQNAHNLVSVSTDGRVCAWNIEKLVAPQEVLKLQGSNKKDAAVTSLSFPGAEVNMFYVGTEDGALYQGMRHGSRPGITDQLEGHAGPITSLENHPSNGPIDFSDIVLTASVDWTVKLWSKKDGSKPVCSFEHAADYVYDAKWSPVHPAMFATVDGMGALDLWNVNLDPEEPITTLLPNEQASALNKVSWARDGRHVCVGDSSGNVYLYTLSAELALPSGDAWRAFDQRLVALRSPLTGSAANQVDGSDADGATDDASEGGEK